MPLLQQALRVLYGQLLRGSHEIKKHYNYYRPRRNFIFLNHLRPEWLLVFFDFVVPGGVVLFSVTFFLTDLLSEFHGEKAARKAVWLGFLAQLLIIPAVWATIRWPHPDFWQGQEAFAATLGNTWRIALASMIAYLVSQHHDVWAYQFWKRKTGGKHLWLRNNLSTIVSQSLDSVIFVTIAFSGLVPIWPIIAGQLVAKIAIALFDTPFMYLARAIWPNSTASSMSPSE
ncbi:MAG: queuosine precursor transporter [Verrucomicrobiales bacterium]